MNTARFLKYIRPFYDIMHERVNWASLNISNTACSIYLTVTLWGISMFDNFRFRISHS